MNYDDNVRKTDATKLMVRDKSAITARMDVVRLHTALALMLTSTTLRPVLEALDPKAVKQAREALLLI